MIFEHQEYRGYAIDKTNLDHSYRVANTSDIRCTDRAWCFDTIEEAKEFIDRGLKYEVQKVNSYRPEGWVGRKYEEEINAAHMAGLQKNTLIDTYEAGADAMLEALRKIGIHFTKEEVESGVEPIAKTDVAGTWVFIPDKEE